MVDPLFVTSLEMGTMWLPDKLYELPPYLYGVAGLVTVNYFETPVGYASGFRLLLTACLVWMMRRDYRQDRKKKLKQ